MKKKKNLYRYVMQNESLDFYSRQTFGTTYVRNYTDTFITRTRNRCILTGRGRGVLSRFKVSRHMFKKLANNGLVNGVRKIR